MVTLTDTIKKFSTKACAVILLEQRAFEMNETVGEISSGDFYIDHVKTNLLKFQLCAQRFN